MDTQHRAKSPWVVILLLGLGVLLGLLGSGDSQEGSPKSAVGTAAVEQAKRLEAEINKLYGEGKYAAALPLAQQVVALREQALGSSHPDVAQGLNKLALLYRTQGQYAQAKPLYQRALTIWEQALGPTHPNVAISLSNLAELFHAKGDYTHVVQLLTRSSEIREHTLALMLALGTEAQKLASAITLRSETNFIVSLHTTFAPHEPQALRLALTTVLRRKGRVLDAMADALTVLRRHVQPEDQQLLAQWVATRGHLATLVFQGLGTQSPEHYRAQLSQLETQAQQLEAQLSARSATFRTQTQPVTLEQGQAAIPEGAALVELTVYRPFTLLQQWGAERYIAYILHRHGPPTWVELGEAAPIDQAVAQLRTALSGPHHGQVQATARALDELVMRPIRPLLGGVRHLLLAPDGALHLVPFGALVDETQHYLLERFTISYLTTGRDLVRPRSPRPASQPPLIVGNPDFEATGTLPEVQVASALPAARRSAESRALRFTPLPGTAEEVDAVHRLLPASQLLTAGSASEAALKQVQGPQLLHLATHGFFLTELLQTRLTGV